MPNGNSRKKRRNTSALYVTVIAALMLLAVFVGLSVFFKVSEFVVTGTSMYAPEDVVRASGLELESSIFFVKESTAAARIKDALPYVDEVRISRSLPGTISLAVTECYPVASVEASGSVWIIDKNAKILDNKPIGTKTKNINVIGIAPIMPTVGDTLALGDAGTVQFTYLRQVLAGLLEARMHNRVQWLDMTSISAVTFSYEGRLTVNLGKGDNVKDKLWLLEKIAADHPGDETGYVDLSKDGEGHFIPK